MTEHEDSETSPTGSVPAAMDAAPPRGPISDPVQGEVVPEPEPVGVAPAVDAAPVPRKRPWWQHAWAAFGVVVGVVGAVTGVISVVPLLFPDTTTAESLTVSVEPVTEEFSPVYAVSITADWSTLPSSTTHCSPAQQEWLEREGTALPMRYLVSVGNGAGDGATMSLSGFRGKGESGAPATAVAVVCDRTGSGTGAMRAAVLDPATGEGAVYVQRDPSAPKNPLVFNLAPGESGQFALLVQSSADFSGTVVFTGSVGDHVWQQELPVPGGIDVPGVAPERLLISDGSLTCESQPGCDVAAVISSLAKSSGLL